MNERVLDRRTYDKGRAIFKEGQSGDAAYILEKGTIAIVQQAEEGNKQLATLRPGSIFGEMAIIDGSPRMASAVALSQVVCIRIPGDEFRTKISKADPFLRAMLTIFTNNLRNIQQTHTPKPRSLPDIANHLNLLIITLNAFSERTENPGIKEEIKDLNAVLKESIESVKSMSKKSSSA